jgi:hypothetical protein
MTVQDVHPSSGERHRLDEIRGQQRVGLRAKERRPSRGGAVGTGIDAGVVQDLPYGRGGDLDTEGE